MNKDIKKVLILRFSSIGDIVLTSPVPRCIKTQLPDVEVHYATKKSFHGILAANPYIDKIHLLEDSLGDLVQNLRAEKFDFVVDLHNNLRTSVIKLRLGVPSKSFDKLNLKKWLLVNFKINLMPNIHIVDRYMAAAAPLGVKNDDLGLDYFIPEKDEVEKSWLPDGYRNEYVAFVIGAKFATKRLPLERMIELCDRINKPVILVGGPEDIENGEKLERFFQRHKIAEELEPDLIKLNKKTIVYNACGKFNLNQSASLVKGAKYVFSHDTGLMHVAAAFKKQIFSIWGNTLPELGMYPYKTRFSIFENKKIKCRPCSKIGYDKCPKGHFKCMKEVVFDFYLP
ncbi:MAG: glycosyltransferase family 9 protein [Cyclobacteriaceae bacterium]|nr:glycosyltransferase family 9 protein [Cyclobacteriaceae bacterium]